MRALSLAGDGRACLSKRRVCGQPAGVLQATDRAARKQAVAVRHVRRRVHGQPLGAPAGLAAMPGPCLPSRRPAGPIRPAALTCWHHQASSPHLLASHGFELDWWEVLRDQRATGIVLLERARWLRRLGGACGSRASCEVGPFPVLCDPGCASTSVACSALHAWCLIHGMMGHAVMQGSAMHLVCEWDGQAAGSRQMVPALTSSTPGCSSISPEMPSELRLEPLPGWLSTCAACCSPLMCSSRRFSTCSRMSLSFLRLEFSLVVRLLQLLVHRPHLRLHVSNLGLLAHAEPAGASTTPCHRLRLNPLNRMYCS